jgi:hypothetical protein
MDFYEPSQPVRDAKQHGFVVWPSDVNASNGEQDLGAHRSVLTVRAALLSERQS